MYSGSVAATGTHSAGRAVAMSSAQSESRPATSGASSWGRCRMMQRRGFTSASSIALSSSGLYGTTRFTSMPHEAETITTGPAGLIPVAPSDTLAEEHAGEPGDRIAQLAIRERLDRARDGAVVNQGGLVGAAVLDVPVERVHAGVDGGARKPTIERRARAIEDPIPAFGPVDGLARFGPEPLRVPGPPRIHLGLGALRGVEARRGAHDSAVRESGAEGARTPDLLGAIQALSQLSYSPVGRRNLDCGPLTEQPLQPNRDSPTDRP